MKKITIMVFVLFIAYNMYAQQKCETTCISNRIDSICKAYKIDYCEVYFYRTSSYEPKTTISEKQVEGKFKLDNCFLIVNSDTDDYYFNLSKLITFHIHFKRWKSDSNYLILYFQGI